MLNATFGSPSAGSYDPGSGLWSGLNLASGQSVSITRSGVIGIATGTLINTVTVSLPAGLGDPNPGNNAATDTDTLVLFSGPYPPPPPGTSADNVATAGCSTPSVGMITLNMRSASSVQAPKVLQNAA